MQELLFVYGTLRRRSRHPMAKLLAERGRYLGEARIAGQLYDLGRFPGLIDLAEPGDWVYGDLYELDADTLAELDEYEGIESPQPGDFDRQRAQVILAENHHSAWVYWYRGDVSTKPRILDGQYQP